MLGLVVMMIALASCANPRPHRAPWQEQIKRLQAELAKIDAGFTLCWVHANPPAIINKLPDQDDPLPQLESTRMRLLFLNPQTKAGAWVTYEDMRLDETLAIERIESTQTKEDYCLGVAGLDTSLPIGPFDVYQSTITTALKLASEYGGFIVPNVRLKQDQATQQEFGMAAVWYIEWTNYWNNMESSRPSGEIWIDPQTGGILKIIDENKTSG